MAEADPDGPGEAAANFHPEQDGGEEAPRAPQPPAPANDTAERWGALRASWQAGKRVSPDAFRAPPAWTSRLPRRAAFQTAVPSRRGEWRGKPAAIDWRKTARRWARLGVPGLEVVPLPARRQPSRIVLLWDVSGSMAEVRDVSLAFAYGLVRNFPRQAAVFPFGTRVADVTRALRGPFPLAAAELARLEGLWAGGTRIGGVLTDWLETFAARWLRPDTTVLILSDGWDVGEPEVLERAVRRICAAGSRIYWLNPLQATPGFAPRTRALRTVRPYVAGMFPAASPEDFLRLMRHVPLPQ